LIWCASTGVQDEADILEESKAWQFIDQIAATLKLREAVAGLSPEQSPTIPRTALEVDRPLQSITYLIVYFHRLYPLHRLALTEWSKLNSSKPYEEELLAELKDAPNAAPECSPY